MSTNSAALARPSVAEIRSQRGFTLVELLVVIGIIALLISILLPSLAKAKKAANTVKCLANMKQLLTSTMQYTVDWKGQLPANNWLSLDTANPLLIGWLYQDSLKSNPWSPNDVKTGCLYPYMQNAGMYRCPEDGGPWPNSTAQFTSYLMNGAFCGYGKGYYLYGSGAYKSTSILYWELFGQNAGQGNDGSSFPSEILTQRHNTGTVIGIIDFHADVTTEAVHQLELNDQPGRWWCYPGSDTGM